MSSPVLKVNNLAKKYRIGLYENSHDTLGSQLTSLFISPFKNFSRIRKLSSFGEDDGNDVIWAMKDISFELESGDVLGIIGKNGAGKSTLLKVLSRITKPTSGSAIINGKIASLLEVGTGFHLELTGRENIYLNGTILGMNKSDVDRKFDEIVAFSGVEKFLDTPVKRYSSGMGLRLAFAVAAHLEPEILIIDEVLAVGDAEFQKKCLGKMKDVAGEGRTVLFVSHNMSAVSSLCNKLMVLQEGEVSFFGDVRTGIGKYLKIGGLDKGFTNLSNEKLDRRGPRNIGNFSYVGTMDSERQACSVFRIGSSMNIKFKFEIKKKITNLELGFTFINILGVNYGGYVSTWEGFNSEWEKGEHEVIVEIPYIYLMPGMYSLCIWLKKEAERIDDQITDALEFEVIGDDFTGNKSYFERYSQLGTFNRSTWQVLE